MLGNGSIDSGNERAADANGLGALAGAQTVWAQGSARETIARSPVSELLPGPRYIALYLIALPAAVVALASSGRAQLVSGLIAALWFAGAPAALFSRTAAKALPVVSAFFLVVTVLTLPFNSIAFATDLTTTVVMFLVSFPRPKQRHLAN